VKEHLAELVHIAFLEKDYARAAGYVKTAGAAAARFGKTGWDNNDAWTSYRIGQSLAVVEGQAAALPWLARAVELAPYHLEFQSVYGASLAQTGQPQKARETFEFILSEQPNHTQALANLGFILLSQSGDTARARSLYERALAMDPDYLTAQYNLAGLYIYQKAFDRATALLGDILRRHPGEEKAREILRTLGGP
jgi:tetratricopeptide (TPR) repeat protein